MEQDDNKKHVDISSFESGGGKMIRQVTMPRAEEHHDHQELDADTAVSAKRSLFANASKQSIPSNSYCPPRYNEPIPDFKRAKRSLDFEPSAKPPLLQIACSEDNPCLSDDDSRATTPTPLDPPTQEVEYSQDSTVSKPPDCAKELLALQVVYGGDGDLVVPVHDESSGFSIGRYDSNDFSIFSRYVSSHQHCVLRQTTVDGQLIVALHAVARTCWIAGDDGRWKEVEKGKNLPLSIGQRFRLILSPKQGSEFPDIASTVEFRLWKLPASLLPPKQRFSLVPEPKLVTPPLSDSEGEFECRRVELSLPTASSERPGSVSFDWQYKILLEKIRDHGHVQDNNKGSSLTLGSCFGLEIDLTDSNTDNDGLGKFLLPLTTLRSLFGGRATIVEAMFYLRGEDNIAFLQQHGCKFWDKQADEDLFIGYNYGLLTNFPQGNDDPPINQLESKVISKLVDGECSRNMVCSLLKPGEWTTQVACTSSIQFSVSNEGGCEVLDMTVNQRSSDVILGLPHDVCCWSIILHLVRREVFKRCGRRLAAGRVFFIIAAGGAHSYEINKPEFQELLKRKPIMLDDSPELIIESDMGLFDMARNYQRNMMRVKGYSSRSHHPAIKIEQAV